VAECALFASKAKVCGLGVAKRLPVLGRYCIVRQNSHVFSGAYAPLSLRWGMENLAPNGTSNGDNGGKYDSEIEDMTRKTGSIGSMKDDSTIMKGDAGAKAKDFAEYFCSYAYLYHQVMHVKHPFD